MNFLKPIPLTGLCLSLSLQLHAEEPDKPYPLTSSFEIEPQSIHVDLEPMQSAEFAIDLFNDSDEELSVIMTAEQGGVAGSVRGELRENIDLTDLLGPGELFGIAFDGQYYWCSTDGPTNGGYVYRIDRRDRSVTQFYQPLGMTSPLTDLEWDGEALWGLGDGWAYQFTPDFEVAANWQAPSALYKYFAWDEERQIFWMAGNTSAVTALRRDGTRAEIRIEIGGLRPVGLEYRRDERGGYDLLLMHRNMGWIFPIIYELNPDSAHYRPIGAIEPPDNLHTIRGVSLSRDWDDVGSIVTMTAWEPTRNNAAQCILVRQFAQNPEWLQGPGCWQTISPRADIYLYPMIFSSNPRRGLAFEPGVYSGSFVFTSADSSIKVHLPVELQVSPSAVPKEPENSPNSPALLSAFPNPFNGSTTITFAPGAISRSATRLSVFDLHGREVAHLIDSKAEIRNQRSEIVWNTESLPAGAYLLRLQQGSQVSTRKVVLLR